MHLILKHGQFKVAEIFTCEINALVCKLKLKTNEMYNESSVSFFCLVLSYTVYLTEW